MKKLLVFLVTAMATWIVLDDIAKPAPPILYQVSHRTNDPTLVQQVWRTHAAIRKAVQDTALYMVSQQRPRLFDARIAPRWAQVIPVRDAGGRHVIQGPDGGPVYLPSGHQDMTLTPERILFLAHNKLTREPNYPPTMLVIDEITANTADEITAMLWLLEQKIAEGTDPAYAEIRNRLAFYVVGGDTVRPQSFPRFLRRWIARNQSPVYAELYGGKIGRDPRSRIWVNARMQGYALRWMKKMRWNVRPMVSAKKIHIGVGAGSVKALKWRIDAAIRNTGMRPAVWHLNSGRIPAARGLARMVLHTSSNRYQPPRLTPRETREIQRIVRNLNRSRAKR